MHHEESMSRETSSKSELPELRRPLPNGIRAEWSKVSPSLLATVRNASRSQAWPLVLWGNVGSGKTCLSALIYASWNNANVRWINAVEFARRVQTVRKEGQIPIAGSAYTVGETSLWETTVDTPSLLVVDDLGITDPTPSQVAIIYELIDRRRNKPMIVSTNLDLNEIEQLYDDRIASRLSAGTIIQFATRDLRASGREFKVTEGVA